MEKRVLILFFLLPVCFFSCVKTEVPACPDEFSDYSMFLVVNDKSYENDHTDSDRSMPYAYYISNHFHVWHNLETGEEIKGESYEETAGSSEHYPVSLEGITRAPHQFTSWGNLSGIDAITTIGTYTRADGVEVSVSGVNLHPGGTESTDIYMASESIDLTPGNEQRYTAAMERTKGLLSVEYTSLPADITRLDVSFGPVYAHIAVDGTYSGSVTVTESFPVGQSAPAANYNRAPEAPASVSTFLAPTIDGTPSRLNISLYRDGDTEPVVQLPTDGLTIKDNVITHARIGISGEGQWELWIKVDGAWEMVCNLIVVSM